MDRGSSMVRELCGEAGVCVGVMLGGVPGCCVRVQGVTRAFVGQQTDIGCAAMDVCGEQPLKRMQRPLTCAVKSNSSDNLMCVLNSHVCGERHVCAVNSNA